MNEATTYREYGNSCYFHPKEFVLGVCHLCLNERLLILAAKQGVKSKSSQTYDYDYFKSNHSFNNNNNKDYCDDNSSYYHNNDNIKKANKSYVNLPKIFGIASLFNTRDNFRRRRRRQTNRQDVVDDVDATSTSLEEDDSFISIKFGDNGVASWDKTSSSVTKVSLEQHCTLSWGGQTTVKDATIKGADCNNTNRKSVVEHSKPRGAATMRWRKRIGQLLQVIRWKKSSNATNAGGGSNNVKVVEGVKVVRNKKGWIRTLKTKTKTKE